MLTDKKDKLAQMTDEVEQFHPLLKILLPKLPNIVDVEYTHGSGEMGADFVLSRRNEVFKNTEYIGVIAKLGKVVQDFSAIERQIDECSVPRFFWGGKEKIRIDEIWVIVTEHITKGAKEKIHEKYKSRKIIFVDGSRLATLIDDYMSAFWTDVSLEVGEYLTSLRSRNEAMDKSLSLLQITDKSFYIEQDIYECPRLDPGIKLQKVKPAKKINIETEIEKNKLILIEAEMGAGKSKLIRRLVDHYATPEVFIEKGYLPVLTNYKELAEDYDGNVEKLINTKVDERMKQDLKEKKYLLLIDGFDEKKLPAEEQIEALKSLFASVNDNANVSAVITSRYLKGFDQIGDLEHEFSRYEIRPLSLHKTIEFITTLCTNLNIKNRIIEDLKKSQLFKELPKTPIAAILLAKLLNENSKELPSNMTELYSKYTEFMLGRWDIDKGLQSQKEYQALDKIMMEFGKYLMTNEMFAISINDAKEIFESYLKARNLDIETEALFDKMISRCEIIMTDVEQNILTFKHRTFAEFFYAKTLIAERQLVIDERALQLYWMNTFFFYLGILKDCPDVLREIMQIEPTSEPERWLKVVNMSNYFLAAYASPYEVISEGIRDIMIEAAKLYRDIITGKIVSPFATLTRMQILFLLQILIRSGYSYDFFKRALEEAAIAIDGGKYDEDIKAYSLYFLDVSYIELGAGDSFDFLLREHSKDLPIDLSVAIGQEAEHSKNKAISRATLVKKQAKRVKDMIKGNPRLASMVRDFYEKPVESMYEKSAQKKLPHGKT